MYPDFGLSSKGVELMTPLGAMLSPLTLPMIGGENPLVSLTETLKPTAHRHRRDFTQEVCLN